MKKREEGGGRRGKEVWRKTEKRKNGGGKRECD
jgi:hypothetical protein